MGFIVTKHSYTPGDFYVNEIIAVYDDTYTKERIVEELDSRGFYGCDDRRRSSAESSFSVRETNFTINSLAPTLTDKWNK